MAKEPEHDATLKVQPSARPDAPLRLTITPILAPKALTPGAAPVIQQVRIQPGEKSERKPLPVFETIRIVDLWRVRVSIRRQIAAQIRKGLPEDAYPVERRQLLAHLDAQHTAYMVRMPEVVVIRRPQMGEIQTNFAVVGETIYLGEHLSASWQEGKESLPFFVTLRDALLAFDEGQQSRFEAVKKNH